MITIEDVTAFAYNKSEYLDIEYAKLKDIPDMTDRVERTNILTGELNMLNELLRVLNEKS